MRILAIDPGNIESGYADISLPDFKLHAFGKVENHELARMCEAAAYSDVYDAYVIERIVSYGMAVGASVFDTCVWVGRFQQILGEENVSFVFRPEEKMCLCHSMKAKDANIRQALIDRYAKFDGKNGKGTKANPDTFYGVSKDAWAAIAVGVTHFEKVGAEK